MNIYTRILVLQEKEVEDIQKPVKMRWEWTIIKSVSYMSNNRDGENIELVGLV
jgi:hypothetical protein